MDEVVHWPKLGNPLSWSIAERCYAIALLMIVSTSIMFVAALAGGWPFLPFPAELAPQLPAAHGVALACWGVLAIASRIARRRESGGTGLAITTTALYAVTLAAFTLVTGPFASPGWISYLGGAVVGYVLFPRWIVLSGIVLYAVLVSGGALLRAPLVAPEVVFAGLDSAMVIRRTVSSLAVFSLTFVVIAWIADRWRDREARYQRLASVDALTGLMNRRRFFAVAGHELVRSRRYGSPLSVILVDLDHFKRINDEHGHLIGDRALAHAARILASEIRDVDTIARYGGEEFAILLPMTGTSGAKEVAERCARQLGDARLQVDGIAPLRVTASMGVASTEANDETLEDVLQAADAALYRAKQNGRDRVEIASTPERDAAGTS